MPVDIQVARNREDLPNLPAFITILRRLKKSSVVETGTRILWSIYRNADLRQGRSQDAHLMNAYGPRIIILALATANNSRNLVMTPDGFRALSAEYLGIYDGLPTGFLDQEAPLVKAALQEAGVIPERYLDLGQIRQSCFEMTLTRLLRSQHEGYMTSLEEFLRAYRIFEIWDNNSGGQKTQLCRTVFGMDAVHFFRSGFMLFALANDENRQGFLRLSGLTADERVLEEYQITPETCRLVASRVSFNDTDLRGWYENMLREVPECYQKFFPVPLFRYPLIHLNRQGHEIDYIVPSPAMFVRGFVNAFFAQLFENADNAGFGNAIEQCTYEALVRIFGQENVVRIENVREHADFLIRRQECDLVLEIKTALGGYEDQSIMAPTSVQRLWSRLYKASQQCTASISEYRQGDHPIMGIIIVSEHITAEAMPFLSLAERTGLFRDMNILGIEILSWQSIEYTLSQTSVASFMATLKRKWIEGRRQSAGDLLTFEVERGAPAHAYEHLDSVRAQIFPGRD